MKKFVVLLLVVVLVLGVFACCGTTPVSAATTADSNAGEFNIKNITIGFATKGMFSPFFGKMEVAAKEYSEELGFTLIFQAPDVETNVTRQIEILENFIVSGVDAIVFSPCDDLMLNSTIVKANGAGISVILINDTLDDGDLKNQGGHYYSYVGTAQYDASKLGGEWLAKRFPEGGQIATLGLVEGVSAGVDRVNGVLEQLPDTFKHVAHQPGDAERGKAFDITQNYLTAYPDLRYIFAACDEMALGACEAIEQAGRRTGEIIVIGMDGNDDAIEAVNAGTLAATIVQNPGQMAKDAIDVAIAVLRGKTVDPVVYTPASLAIANDYK